VIFVGGKTQDVLRAALQCGRGQGKVQQVRSRCGQRTEIADAVRTEEGNFLSVPSLQSSS